MDNSIQFISLKSNYCIKKMKFYRNYNIVIRIVSFPNMTQVTTISLISPGNGCLPLLRNIGYFNILMLSTIDPLNFIRPVNKF